MVKYYKVIINEEKLNEDNNRWENANTLEEVLVNKYHINKFLKSLYGKAERKRGTLKNKWGKYHCYYYEFNTYDFLKDIKNRAWIHIVKITETSVLL